MRAFTIVIPPPNVTGSLHMGHALNNTIQDVVIRRHRMTGQAHSLGRRHRPRRHRDSEQGRAEARRAEGLSRHDVGREGFIEACWEWRREYGSTIIEQLKAMGCWCDYSDERFTMDPSYPEAVRKVFVDWFDDGPDLPRQAHHQLVSALPHGALRHRGRARGSRQPSSGTSAIR